MKKVISDIIAYVIGYVFAVLDCAVLQFSHNWIGLGNRIKGICNFYARGYRGYLILWKNDTYITAKFSDLFVLDGCRVLEIDSDDKVFRIITKIVRRFYPQGIVTESTPFWSLILPSSLRSEKMQHVWSFSKKKTYSVDWWYNKTPENVIQYFLPFFKSLKRSLAVKKRCDEVQDKVANCVTVQIRCSGDHNDEKDVCSLDTIISKMKCYPMDTNFFVAYFAQGVGERLKAEFPGRIIELPNKDCDSMVDAVAEIWLLGHGSEMLVSPSSTFSEVAWWWGLADGKINEVTVLRAEYNQRDIAKSV